MESELLNVNKIGWVPNNHKPCEGDIEQTLSKRDYSKPRWFLRKWSSKRNFNLEKKCWLEPFQTQEWESENGGSWKRWFRIRTLSCSGSMFVIRSAYLWCFWYYVDRIMCMLSWKPWDLTQKHPCPRKEHSFDVVQITWFHMVHPPRLKHTHCNVTGPQKEYFPRSWFSPVKTSWERNLFQLSGENVKKKKKTSQFRTIADGFKKKVIPSYNV